MTDTEFLALAEAALSAIESGLERVVNESDADIEFSRSGNVLEVEFVDKGSKIIVNIQSAMHELWVAARSGGFHYRYLRGQSELEGDWRNTRDGSELFAALSAMIAEQGSVEVCLTPEDC